MWRNESQALSHWIKQNKVAKFIQEVIDIHQLLRSTLHLNVNQFFSHPIFRSCNTERAYFLVRHLQENKKLL